MAFPHYQQTDEMDCGATSLRIIAKYYGKAYSTEMLRRHCHITRNGVSMLGISEAAEYIGFRTLGVKITFKQLANEAKLPCILHWNQNHFVVCYKIEKKKKGEYKIFISDPASGKISYTKDEFMKCWGSTRMHGEDCGTALLLTPSVSFGKRDEEETEIKHGIAFLYKYLLPYKPQLTQLVAAMTIGSLLQLAFPFLTQALVDLGINGGNMGLITIILIAQLTFFIARLSTEYIRSWILLHVNSRIGISLLSDFLIKLMNMPLHFFDTKKTGDIMQRIDDHSRIRSFLTGNSLSMAFSMVSFVIFALVLAYMNLLILIIFLIGNGMYIAWVSFFMKYRRTLDYKRFTQAAAEQNKIIQLIQGIQDIKLNNSERRKRWEWERVQVKLFRISVKGLTIGQLQQVGSLFFSQTSNIIITFMAARYVVNGEMTLGMMMSLIYIVGQVSAPVNDFINFIQVFQDAKISLERLNEIHERKDENDNIDVKTTDIPQDKTINIKNVTFSYDGAERNYALENVSLTVPANKVTAIVGESGSGKTTLIKLMQGFYRPTHGSIDVGGIDLNDINPHTWRNITGSVMQESFIFSDSIANNIAVDSDEIDTKNLQRAATLANADSFIRNLPLGYNTTIGMEGIGLSQGQRQRVLIARAIYKNPDFIFLDEATNALDTANEAEIMRNLNEFYKGRTVVIAAHRLSTVKTADQIIVLKHGKVVECGTHESLVRLRGYYFELIKNQIELNS